MSHQTSIIELLDRFPEVKTWEDFQERWADARTQGEAIGLLHEGTNLFARSRAKSGELVRLLPLQIPFYLDLAKHAGHHEIGTLAAQLIVKFWLREASIFPAELIASTHAPLLNFLTEGPRDGFSQPPYPRFVTKYLSTIHRAWSRDSDRDVGWHRAHEALREYDRLVVLALCRWGLGHLLGDRGGEERVLPYLEEYFIGYGRLPEPGSILFRFIREQKPPEDLSTPRSHDESRDRALAAYQNIRYHHGPGTWLIRPNRVLSDPESSLRHTVFGTLRNRVVVDQPPGLPSESLLFSRGPMSLTDEIVGALQESFHLVPKQ